MKHYTVTCTVIYNGSVDVVAGSGPEAIDKARRLLDAASDSQLPDDGKIGKVPFTFGEATADYAETR